MKVRAVFVLAAVLVFGASGRSFASFPHEDLSLLASALAVPVCDTCPADSPRPKELQPESKLLLIRNVSGEFAKALQPIPGGKKGFTLRVGKAVNPQALRDALRLQGQAAGAGDRVQVTNIDFRPHEVVVEINGGAKKHFHLRDHLQVGMGAGPVDAPPPLSHPNEGIGGVLILDYGHPLRDMTPEDLKRDLSAVLDFSGEHSASTNWVETLAPQFQQGIKDRKAVLGMNREILIAAMGRPDKKVREKDDSGIETEDWIYGTPPDKTIFVTFSGDTVIRIKEFE
jgi:hypothetical protein